MSKLEIVPEVALNEVLLLHYYFIVLLYRFKNVTVRQNGNLSAKESRIPRGCTTSVKHHKVQTITTTLHSIILFLSNTINGTRQLLFGLLGP